MGGGGVWKGLGGGRGCFGNHRDTFSEFRAVARRIAIVAGRRRRQLMTTGHCLIEKETDKRSAVAVGLQGGTPDEGGTFTKAGGIAGWAGKKFDAEGGVGSADHDNLGLGAAVCLEEGTGEDGLIL